MNESTRQLVQGCILSTTLNELPHVLVVTQINQTAIDVSKMEGYGDNVSVFTTQRYNHITCDHLRRVIADLPVGTAIIFSDDSSPYQSLVNVLEDATSLHKVYWKGMPREVRGKNITSWLPKGAWL